MYRMPAEWERQEATWLAWPYNEQDWPGKFEPIPWVYAEIIRHVSKVERVRLAVRNAREERTARDYLKRAGVNMKQLDIYSIPTDRVWMRDSGPIFVRDALGQKSHDRLEIQRLGEI
jgi:agmatine deiminase